MKAVRQWKKLRSVLTIVFLSLLCISCGEDDISVTIVRVFRKVDGRQELVKEFRGRIAGQNTKVGLAQGDNYRVEVTYQVANGFFTTTSGATFSAAPSSSVAATTKFTNPPVSTASLLQYIATFDDVRVTAIGTPPVTLTTTKSFSADPSKLAWLQEQKYQTSGSTVNVQLFTCDLGKVPNFSLATPTCQTCPSGTISNGNECLPAPRRCAAGQSYKFDQATWTYQCSTCGPNTIPSQDELRCEACSLGQQPGTDALGRSVCLDMNCGPGDFYTTNATGAFTCSSCPVGKVPSTDKTKCVECGFGMTSGSSAGYVGQCVPVSSAANQYLTKNLTTGNYEGVTCSSNFVPSQDKTSCLECPAGMIQGSDTYLGQCVPKDCAANQIYDVATNYHSCAFCGAGKVPAQDRRSCETCPTGMIPGSGTYLGQCVPLSCAANQIYGQDASGVWKCVGVPSGTVPKQDRAGYDNCPSGMVPGLGTYLGQCVPLSCAANQYYTKNPTTNLWQCTNAPSGTVPAQDRFGYTNCPLGMTPGTSTYLGQCVPLSCLATQRYTFNSSSNLSSCSACTGNTVPSQDRLSCVACPAGKTASNGLCGPLPCAGKLDFIDTTPSGTSCYTCSGNSVPSLDRTACVSCPPYTQSDSVTGRCEPVVTPGGLNFIEQLFPSGPYESYLCSGNSVPSLDRTACVSCPIGTTANPLTGTCTPQYCPADNYKGKDTLTGEITCSVCAPGQVPNALHTGCQDCPFATIPDSVNAGQCVPLNCGTGTYVTFDNSLSTWKCSACPAGKVPSADKRKCV